MIQKHSKIIIIIQRNNEVVETQRNFSVLCHEPSGSMVPGRDVALSQEVELITLDLSSLFLQMTW